MNGMDMLVNAALKATGFSREQLDEGMTNGRAKLEDFERRFVALETNIGEVLAILKGKENAADVPRLDAPES